MSDMRQQILDALIGSIQASPLPQAQTSPLAQAIRELHASRPNAMDKIQAPLGRALRNPMFPEIWERCVADIPTSPPYDALRDAARGIAAFVGVAR
jgi:hypothetical protein